MRQGVTEHLMKERHRAEGGGTGGGEAGGRRDLGATLRRFSF